MKKYIRNGDSPQTKPTDRSISPQTSSSASPMAMIAVGAVACEMLSRLSLLRKWECAELMKPKETKSRAAITKTLASRSSRRVAPPRLRKDPKPVRAAGCPPAGPRVPALRWAVSLTSIVRSVWRFRPAYSRSGHPRRAGGAATCPASESWPGRRGTNAGVECRSSSDQIEIAPDLLRSFCALVDPSYLLDGLLYGATLALVTNVRPVSVAGGETRPPDSLYRYMYRVGRKPCRYGDWSMVKSRFPAAIAVRVAGSRSNPPDETLPASPYFASAGPSSAVEPPSTAKTPCSLDPLPWMNAGMLVVSWVCDAPLSNPAVCRIFRPLPAARMAAFAPSRRGWMFSDPGCAMMPHAVPPCGIFAAIRVPTAWPETYSSWPMYAMPLVGLLTAPLAL